MAVSRAWSPSTTPLLPWVFDRGTAERSRSFRRKFWEKGPPLCPRAPIAVRSRWPGAAFSERAVSGGRGRCWRCRVPPGRPARGPTSRKLRRELGKGLRRKVPRSSHGPCSGAEGPSRPDRDPRGGGPIPGRPIVAPTVRPHGALAVLVPPGIGQRDGQRPFVHPEERSDGRSSRATPMLGISASLPPRSATGSSM